jgi:hypothetical protein
MTLKRVRSKTFWRKRTIYPEVSRVTARPWLSVSPSKLSSLLFFSLFVVLAGKCRYRTITTTSLLTIVSYRVWKKKNPGKESSSSQHCWNQANDNNPFIHSLTCLVKPTRNHARLQFQIHEPRSGGAGSHRYCPHEDPERNADGDPSRLQDYANSFFLVSNE